MARLPAALRHRQQAGRHANEYHWGSVRIDSLKHVVEKDGKTLYLTPKELGLLFVQMKNVDPVMIHRQILMEVWGPAHTQNVQYLKVFIG